MDIDDVYIRTGEFGRFQVRAFIGCCLYSMFCGTEMVLNIFAGSIPAYKLCINNKIDACDEHCTQILYPNDTLVSFATEWNMTCGTDVTKVQSTQSIYMAGVMVGSFFMGGLGDKYGRFPVLITSQALCAFFGFVSSFATSWTSYAVLRFFTGFFLTGVIIVGFVLTSELVGPSKRGIIGTLPAGAFAAGMAVLSLTAWVTQNWRTMSALLGASGIFLVPVIYCLYEESPRWHLGRGNTEKCQAILKKIANLNGHELGNINLKVTGSGGDGKSSDTSMLSLFRNRTLRKLTLIQLVTWSTASSVYFGLTIASGETKGNKYISVTLNSLVEIPSNLAIMYVMNMPRFGRVNSCFIGFLISSIFCGSIWFIDEGHATLIVGLACAGKFFIVTSFAVIYVQAAELYPTPVRNVGMGLVSVFNRVGGILAPQIVTLNNLYHNAHFLVFGVVGCIAGFLCLLLPETLGRPLPDTPEDLYRQVKKSDKEVISMKLGDKQSLLSGMDDEEQGLRT